MATPTSMERPLDNPACFSRRTRRIAVWLAITLPLYALSTGPVAWASNDTFHPAYLPDQVWFIYLPLVPLMKIPGAKQLFEWWTAIIWQGFPAGYTTL